VTWHLYRWGQRKLCSQNVGGPYCTPKFQNRYYYIHKVLTSTLSLTVFKQRNFVADFLQAKCDFIPKSAVLRFKPTFVRHLGATYDDHLRLTVKHAVDFLLVLIELFR